ncbi:MAG: T9SS type A sorting domain-containing protein [bacterium]|nr:T9SS type A sorting domain-containing protein [bacterium]
MKTWKLVLLFVALSAMAMIANATDVTGPVTGTWTAVNNPYNVIGEINVPIDQTLTIQPGVQVIFQGHYRFIVNSGATLHAVGTMQDSIHFTAPDTLVGWNDLVLLSASNNTQLAYCVFEWSRGNDPDTGAGAIFCEYSNITLNHTSFRNNRTDMYANGGAMYVLQSDISISNSEFINNQCTWAGGAIRFEENTNATVNNCLFVGNYSVASGAAIFCGGGAATTITNSTFTQNVSANNSGVIVNNGVVRNCIVWGNQPNIFHDSNPIVSYSCIEGGWPGTGNIDVDPLFVEGYHLQQPPCQPLPQSPCVNAGDPAFPMIIGSTRTDGVQDQGVVDMGYHYTPALPPQPPTLDVNISPIHPPIVIPAGGGSFQYNVDIHNLLPGPQLMDLWNKVRDAANNYYNVGGPLQRMLNGGQHPYRVLTQNIARTIPSGTLYFIAYVGTYPNIIQDSSFFTITKSTVDDGGPWISESKCEGNFLEEYAVNATVPETPALLNAYPNPFNPVTTISYTLPAAARVKLSIYDIGGRLLATLVDGYRDAGVQQVSFDAAELPSGIYMARLEFGSCSQVQKLVLLK